MISELVITLNIFNTIPSFAKSNNFCKDMNEFCNKYAIINNGITTDLEHYMSKVIVDDKDTTIIKYLDGSWYSYNTSKSEYKFKPIESDIPLNFSSIKAVQRCRYDYANVKEKNDILSDRNSLLKGFSRHSDIIYADNLKTDENLNKYARQWLKDNYNLILDIPINYSDSMKDDRCGYTSILDNKPINIKLNKQIQNVDILSEKTLIHELTHYALLKLNTQYHDETSNFTQECVKNGSNTNDDYVGLLQSHLQSTL
jgi:hypothetical protein